MQNRPGSGPTRPDKTIERMSQERLSPGATSAGGHGAEAPGNDTALEEGPDSTQAPSSTSAQTDARRGDVARAPNDATTPQTDAAPELRQPGESTPAMTREERIREAAYRLSQGRGDGTSGDATTDWLQAEAEIDLQDQKGPG